MNVREKNTIVVYTIYVNKHKRLLIWQSRESTFLFLSIY